jgi:tetratricopeptide (TPR) repeat protein
MTDFLKEAAANGLGSLTAVLLVKLGEFFCSLVRGRKNEVPNPQPGEKEKKKPQNSNIHESHNLPANTNTNKSKPLGLPALLRRVRRRNPSQRMNEEAKAKRITLPQLLLNKYVLFVLIFISILIISTFTCFNITGTLVTWIFGPSSEHEKLIAEAWDAVDHHNPTQAIGAAEKVIDNYANDAVQAEEELEKSQEPLPPVGPLCGSERKRIFARGLLNDVASAYWIAGQAYEQMGNFAKACEDYRVAARLRYARTWDPARPVFRSSDVGGQFWSPATKAAGRVQGKCGGNPN